MIGDSQFFHGDAPWGWHSHSRRVQGQHKGRPLSEVDELCFDCPYDECHMGYPLCPFDAQGRRKEVEREGRHDG